MYTILYTKAVFSLFLYIVNQNVGFHSLRVLSNRRIFVKIFKRYEL
jgi:hypothetical protein